MEIGKIAIQIEENGISRSVAVDTDATLLDVLREYFRLTGTGLLDTTRIAAGGPEIWKHIFTSNRDNVLAALDDYQGNLAELRAAIESSNEAELDRILTAAKKNRDALAS